MRKDDKPSIKRMPRVLLAVDTFRQFGRGVAEGVMRHSLAVGPWEVIFEPVLHELEGHRQRGIDGVITELRTRRFLGRWRRHNVPVVVVGDSDLPCPTVVTDHRVAGRLACEHFRHLGLRHAAYTPAVASPTLVRYEAFIQAAGDLGLQVHHPPQLINGGHWTRWLRSLPKPIGLYVGQREDARQLAYRCRHLQIRVPEQIAILSNSTDPLWCGLSSPPLSGFEPHSDRIGRRAAEMLERLMKDEPLPARHVKLPPRGIAVRHSSDVVAVEHPQLAEALRFIREHAVDGIKVDDVLDAVPISRRGLELAFRKHLNTTAHQEIIRVRVNRTRRMLADTDMLLVEIAVRCGYSSLSELCNVFKRRVGRTPGQYRRWVRGLDRQ
jgi:LacI family transcriptional regulator